MSINVKRFLAFVLGFGITCLLVWVGGLDFDKRSIELALTLSMALMFGVLGAYFPFSENSR